MRYVHKSKQKTLITRIGKASMDRITFGFRIAALYNSFILLFSKGFSNDLGDVDPLFSSGGCVGILLWGAAYFALSRRYKSTPSITLVFCIEKAFYGFHWLFWIINHHQDISPLLNRDPLVGSFFAIYGIGDLIFMIFFAWVAWKWRHNMMGELK